MYTIVFSNHTRTSFVAGKCASTCGRCVMCGGSSSSLCTITRGCSGSQRCDSAVAFATHGKFRNSTHLAGWPETIQAIVPIPDALVSRTCVTGNQSRGPSLLSSLPRWDISGGGDGMHNCSSRVVNFIHLCGLLPKRFPKDQYKVLRELGYSDKKFTAGPFFISKEKESIINYLKNIYIFNVLYSNIKYIFSKIYFIFRYNILKNIYII